MFRHSRLYDSLIPVSSFFVFTYLFNSNCFFCVYIHQAKSLGSGISSAVHLINPTALFKFTAVKSISQKDLHALQQVGFVYFLYLFLYSGLEFTLTFLTYLRFNYDSMQQGKMFFFLGIIMILVQGGYVRRMKQGSEQRMASRGMLILVPAFVVIGVASSTTVMYLGLVLFSFASATVIPCLTTIVSSYGSADQKGTIMGIFRSLGALARAIGPVVASTVYWCAGAKACYIIGGVAVVIPFVLFRKLKLGQAL